ncbi:MAG: 4-hydroxy-tetrahydrodipicolinate reductase [Firmicutes bacterium]|nr:4-hydroxy-tetrahydrodipicolinate reductase [Bacillota bacterium]
MNVIINGALGYMGRLLTKKVEDAPDMEIAALVDHDSDGESIYKSLSDVSATWNDNGNAGEYIVIDFSNAAGTEALLEFGLANKIPLLIATTGQSDEQRNLIKEASKEIPLFYSGNMSLGVALLADLVRQTVSKFPDADVEIIETHHVRKVDAPSGTALLLANAAKEARPTLETNVGRNGSSKRGVNEIGISSVRRGNIVGIHEVIISTESQSITLKHEAHDRGLFADGAISAAKFLVNQTPGLYDMKSLID